jgi:hypothetical protein
VGAFRDDREALLARVEALEGELSRGKRDAALAEIQTLRRELAEASARIRRDEDDLATFARRIDVLEGTLRGDVVTTPAPSRRPVLVVALCGAMLVLVVLAAVLVRLRSPEPIEIQPIPPIPPTAPVPPSPPPEPIPSPIDPQDDFGVPETPRRDDVAAAFRATAADAQRCGRHLPMGTTSVAHVRIAFGSDGAPRSVQVDGLITTHPSAASCVEHVFGSVRVPPFARETFHVTFPVRLQSG